MTKAELQEAYEQMQAELAQSKVTQDELAAKLAQQETQESQPADQSELEAKIIQLEKEKEEALNLANEKTIEAQKAAEVAEAAQEKEDLTLIPSQFPKEPFNLVQEGQKPVQASDGLSKIWEKEKDHVIVRLFLPERDGVTGKLKFPPFIQKYDPRGWETVAKSSMSYVVMQYINLPEGCKTVEHYEKEAKIKAMKPRMEALKAELSQMKDLGLLEGLV